MTAQNPRPYVATLPETACAEHQHEGRFEITRCDDDVDAVASTVWCRVCLTPLRWIHTDLHEGDTAARLYCGPLPVAALPREGETPDLVPCSRCKGTGYYCSACNDAGFVAPAAEAAALGEGAS